MNNGERASKKMAFIEADGGRYDDKYLVTIQKLSLSKEAFQFFELVNQQLSVTGDIFDPPPTSIIGNLVNLDEPDRAVIGYFFASDVSQKSAFIPREMLENPFRERYIPDDCRTLPGSTDERPIWWD